MSRNIITYNLNSEVATVNGVHLDKEQSIEITKIIEEKNHCIAELEKELEVYKRAFKNEIPSNYYELENVETDEEYIELRLNLERKELEDERN